ncbi:hypothetical protein C6Q04_07790 [Burkholderia multivorans]|uniref:hypothetical protein n=1 Tax=Burkholderia multivorans TaxID=87883 RepID=UPI000CFF244C|nr:hypothetical protein [Burkholderia multivorans]PRF49350.1 hypothetical protein C6Q04_07790 [Burkholderia multivorans]HEF4776474.1 hypothetical protein [Burkholderia multivorans]HEF4823720.1 hypothetical protein [Burkholderia multivorans]
MYKHLLVCILAGVCAHAIAGPPDSQPRSATARLIKCKADIAPLQEKSLNLYEDMLAMCVQKFVHDAEPQELATYMAAQQK